MVPVTDATEPYVFHSLADGRRPRTRCLTEALAFIFNRFGISTVGLIKVTRLPLPSGKSIAAVAVLFPDLRCVVSLGASDKFTARSEGSDDARSFEITQLDGATLSTDGHAFLPESGRLRAVELVLTPLPDRLTDREETIIRLVVMQSEASDYCYRNLAHEIPGFDRAELPDLSDLDYGRVRQIIPPSFKEFLRHLEKNNLHLKVSREKFSYTLRKCGLGGRRQTRSATAPI